MTEEQLEEENNRYADEDGRERERAVLVSPKPSNHGGNRTTYNYTAVEHVALVKEVYKEKCQDEGEASPKWKDLAVTLSTMIHKPARVPKVLCQHFKEMVSNIRSAVALISKETKAVPPTYSNECEAYKQYCTQIYAKLSDAKEVKTTKSWWSIEVVIEMQRNIVECDKTFSVISAATLAKALETQQNKFNTERLARGELIKADRDAKKARTEANDLIFKNSSEAITQMATAVATGMANKNNPRETERVDVLEVKLGSIDDKLNKLLEALNNRA